MLGAISSARLNGGDDLEDIVSIIQKHIPEHTRDAILASLNPNLRVINYEGLNVDKEGLAVIMDLGLEAGILEPVIGLNVFAGSRFDMTVESLRDVP